MVEVVVTADVSVVEVVEVDSVTIGSASEVEVVVVIVVVLSAGTVVDEVVVSSDSLLSIGMTGLTTA